MSYVLMLVAVFYGTPVETPVREFPTLAACENAVEQLKQQNINWSGTLECRVKQSE